MSRLRCGPLAAWAGAWLAGTAAFDDVLSAASVGAPAPRLALAAAVRSRGTLIPEDGRVAPLGEVLIAWRRSSAQVRLVLPVPGDVRGLPGAGSSGGTAAFRTAAVDAGQAVIGAGVGVVPVVIEHHPSSAPATLTWHWFDIEEPVPDYVAMTDAQYELTEAIRESASALARVDRQAIEDSPELAGDLVAARRAGERINLPPGFDPRAVSLIAQAERMAAVLAIAGVGDGGEPDERTHALAPLLTAVRRARLAGYNATAQPG